MDLVSIIVPVYNEEKSLPRCLDSLLAQSYSEIEIILVHDSSPDRSGDICDAYAKADNRIRVIHRDANRKGVIRDIGVVAARNAGLAAASGIYVQFADADDYVLPTITEILVATMEKHHVDMAVCEALQSSIDANGNESVLPGVTLPAGRIYTSDFIALILKFRDYTKVSVLWNKMYSKKIIDAHDIRFRGNAMPADDALFNLDYMQYCGELYVDPTPGYVYVSGTTPDTITCKDRYYSNVLDVRLLLCRELEKRLREQNSDLHREYGLMANLLIGGIVNFCRRDATLTKDTIVASLRRLSESRDVREWFQHYHPEKGQSRLIPLLLRLRLITPLFYLARYKADKRYARFYGYGNA